ncbi:MAG: hypothetical protein Q4D51_12360 [Eubacteriales bacterium]|nr:hypothetical protein [Eubacteriales bacterium]
MGRVYLLDCTLRDGGYVNDWRFGKDTIKGFGHKLAKTGVEMFEVGFLKGDTFDEDRAVFPDFESLKMMICPKDKQMQYVGMVDMSAPLPKERIPRCDGSCLDIIRVIFKKDKIDEAYDYCQYVQNLGYKISVNFVGTDMYSDTEFVEGIQKFNRLNPFAMAIVDSFGLIKRKHFMRLVYLADNNLAPGVTLGYHAHNNLQQAFGNAESLVEMNLKRDLCIDACVFGMGRGAGNLNLELFAEYMNENYDTKYRIEPMLEIMDEYLNDIYQKRFWGYSLPLYLSASTGCHPNYAIYLAEKDTLSVKAFNELLNGIPKEDKAKFSKDKAEKYYRDYQENFIDDRETLSKLMSDISDREILILGPGRSLMDNRDCIEKYIAECAPIVIALNFDGGEYKPDYVFSSNMRRYAKIQGKTSAKCIITSNMKDYRKADYIVNFSSYASKDIDIIDNSGVMLLKLLIDLGVKRVAIAGMDGYSGQQRVNYYDSNLEFDFSSVAEKRNHLIAKELHAINEVMKIRFLTPSIYEKSMEE